MTDATPNKSRNAPRPSRKGVPITPHKGGRTERLELRLTPSEKSDLLKLVRRSGMSTADWIASVVAEKSG